MTMTYDNLLYSKYRWTPVVKYFIVAITETRVEITVFSDKNELT